MAVIAWDSRLDTGIGKIDAQHREWVAITNELLAAFEAGGEQEALRAVADRLRDYTRFHFDEEEAFMESIGYPDLAAHREMHRAMAEEVWRIVALDGTAAQADPAAVRKSLVTWLMGHILSEDMRYVRHHQSLPEQG